MERFKPWDNLGYKVENCNNVEEILNTSNLNYEIEEKPVLYPTDEGNMMPILGKKALVRKDNQALISEISSKKSFIQNIDAFNFVDDIITKYGGKVERAGYRDKSSHMIIKMPNESILGDEVEPYLIARNNFSGTGSNLEVFLSPYRLACSNQIGDAVAKSKRVFKSDFYIDKKVLEPALIEILKLKDNKMDMIGKEAERLAKIDISKDEFIDLVDQYYPTSEDCGLSETKIRNNLRNKEGLIEAYNQDDLSNIRDNAWGVFNAFSDYLTHGRIRGELNGEEIDKAKRMMGAIASIQLLALIKSRILKKYGYRAY